MDAPAVCPTLHEDDAPSDTDAFGVHDRIARTIAQVVEQTHGGKTIGLSGTWGAGKSTVVRLLQTMYADRADSRVVWTFDAWAHEGDPLRRTFLESLIATLAERRWLVAAEWTDTLDFLSKRRKVTQRHSAPRLTPMGVLVAISVLLVPLGTVLFSNQIRDGIAFDLDLSIDWLAILGLLLALGPLLSLAAWSAWVRWTRRAGGAWRSELMNALTVFIQRTDTDSYTESLDSGDPTSLEFEAVFRGIMTAALGAHPERRLVLVVDNLDRVGAPQALAVWSTLQTFVQRRGSGGWLDQVWCLLPFDADAIRRLWQKENTPGNPVAESFLDKTFQLRFEVPLPRLANWKDYLVAALSRALPGHTTSDEFFRIYRLYSVRRTANWIAPTPRQLKLFVNQVGSLHRQWQHEIPLEDLAYYVLLQSEGVSIVSMLLAGELPAPAEAGLVSDRARDSLAALVYGSGAGQSHELLLRQPILDALEAGDSSRLDELARVSDKFWLVLELAIEQGCQEWPRAEGGLVLHAAAALDGAGISGLESPWRGQALFRRLGAAVRQIAVWAPMDAKAIDGAIVVAAREPALGRLIHGGFTQQRFELVARMTAAQARDFADDYVRLCRGLGGVGPSTPLLTQDAGGYIEIANALATADPEGTTWSHFGTADTASITKVLTANVFTPGWGTVVHIAASAGISGWTEIINLAGKALKADEGYTSGQQVEMLGALHVLADSGNTEAATLLDDLTDAIGAAVAPERPVERALKMAIAAVGRPADAGTDIAAADPDALGAWLYTILARQGSLSGIGYARPDLDAAEERTRQWIDAKIDTVSDDICGMLAKAARSFGRAQTLFDVARKAHQFRHSPLDRMVMMRVLQMMADMDTPPRVFPPALVINAWEASFPGWSRYEIAMTMRTRRRDVADALVKVPFDWRLASACAGTLDAAGDDDQLRALCTASLPAVSPADWRAALGGGDMGLPQLLAALAKRHRPVALSPDVRSVLRDFVTDPPANQWIDRVTAANIMEAFDDRERDEVVGRLIDEFVSLTESDGLLTVPTAAALARARSLAAFAGSALLETSEIWERPRLFAGVAGYVLGAPALEWFAPLTELARQQPELVRNLSPEEHMALLTLIKRHESSHAIPPEARASLGVLAKVLAGQTLRDAAGPQET